MSEEKKEEKKNEEENKNPEGEQVDLSNAKPESGEIQAKKKGKGFKVTPQIMVVVFLLLIIGMGLFFYKFIILRAKEQKAREQTVAVENLISQPEDEFTIDEESPADEVLNTPETLTKQQTHQPEQPAQPQPQPQVVNQPQPQPQPQPDRPLTEDDILQQNLEIVSPEKQTPPYQPQPEPQIKRKKVKVSSLEPKQLKNLRRQSVRKKAVQKGYQIEIFNQNSLDNLSDYDKIVDDTVLFIVDNIVYGPDNEIAGVIAGSDVIYDGDDFYGFLVFFENKHICFDDGEKTICYPIAVEVR